MKKHTTDHTITPWENILQAEANFEHLEELENHKTHEKHEEQTKPPIVHSVQLNLNNHNAKAKQVQHKQNNIQHYIALLEDKAVKQKLIEQKLHLHQESKKIDVFIKPIAKNDINVTIPEEPLLHPKVIMERPIKHMNKSHKESTPLLEKQEFNDIRNQAQTNIRYSSRKMSVDHLPKANKTTLPSAKKSSEYEDLVIKKCYLKNINFFEGNSKSVPQQKAAMKTEAMKKQKTSDNKHVLDRLLSKLD